MWHFIYDSPEKRSFISVSNSPQKEKKHRPFQHAQKEKPVETQTFSGFFPTYSKHIQTQGFSGYPQTKRPGVEGQNAFFHLHSSIGPIVRLLGGLRFQLLALWAGQTGQRAQRPKVKTGEEPAKNGSKRRKKRPEEKNHQLPPEMASKPPLTQTQTQSGCSSISEFLELRVSRLCRDMRDRRVGTCAARDSRVKPAKAKGGSRGRSTTWVGGILGAFGFWLILLCVFLFFLRFFCFFWFLQKNFEILFKYLKNKVQIQMFFLIKHHENPKERTRPESQRKLKVFQTLKKSGRCHQLQSKRIPSTNTRAWPDMCCGPSIYILQHGHMLNQ